MTLAEVEDMMKDTSTKLRITAHGEGHYRHQLMRLKFWYVNQFVACNIILLYSSTMMYSQRFQLLLRHFGRKTDRNVAID